MVEKELDKKDDLRIRRTYKLLTEALIDLLEEKPFEEIFVTDICDRAMVHRTTFYKHFEDKYHLLKFSILELQKSFIEQSISEPGSDNPKQFYINLLKRVLHFHSTHKKRSLLMIVKSENSTFMHTFHQIIAQSVQMQLEDHKKRGIVFTIPIPVIAHYHAGALIALQKWWLENDMPVTEEELLKYVDLMISIDSYVSLPPI